MATLNVRLTMIAAVFGFSWAAAAYWHQAWQKYWVVTDGVRTIGRVTGEGGHDTIRYTYSVRGTVLSGSGPREYRDPHYARPAARRSSGTRRHILGYPPRAGPNGPSTRSLTYWSSPCWTSPSSSLS